MHDSSDRSEHVEFGRRVIPISRSETNDISALYVRVLVKIKKKVDGIPTASFIQMRPVFEVCDPISELPVKSNTLTFMRQSVIVITYLLYSITTTIRIQAIYRLCFDRSVPGMLLWRVRKYYLLISILKKEQNPCGLLYDAPEPHWQLRSDIRVCLRR